METTLKTAPTVEPVTLDEVKRHIRVDVDNTDDDDYLETLITASRQRVEVITWRKLITQTWYAYPRDWPSGNYIELPFGNLQSVTSATIDGVNGIKYLDDDGDEAAWNSDEYIVGTDYQKGRITLGNGYTWPNETLYPSNPIEIEFLCGYGLAADVPGQIKHAMKIILGEMFENREASVVGTIYASIDTVNDLLSDYRLNEL
jgi:uncharacterized phiE125 gp8 family phage protein